MNVHLSDQKNSDLPASRPNGKSKAATTSEKEFAGHVEEAGGILRSETTVGKTTLKPETKYSYRMY
jgi:hypothetical protein